ncbi:MAG: OmpA family protein [Proteobacteria bacterium]|nr:OmpA family protein [Pseudomonadota bacterium]
MLRLRERINTWPGFVDLFSNLVIILIFLLIVFVFLWTTTSVFNTATGTKKIAELSRVNSEQSAQLAQMTADEQEARNLLLASRSALENFESEKTALQNDIDSLRAQKDALSQQMTAQTAALQQQIADANAQLAAKQDASAQMAAQVQELQSQLATAQAAADAGAASVQQSAQLNAEITRLNALLAASQVAAEQQQTQYVAMSTQLNKALADRVAELNELRAHADAMNAYQSEFYKAVRMALTGFAGVEVDGDRFIIPSDILFASGSFSLAPEGKKQLAIVANVMRQLEDKIPTDVNWIIRVDGHTDSKPVISGTRAFANNTQLSLLRAQAVVNELTADGVAARRLIPSGFGAMYPLVLGTQPADLQKNRRIELRLTNI